ncbi:MAG: YCF48-related protein [Pyrinomonadaceae bacterium]
MNKLFKPIFVTLVLVLCAADARAQWAAQSSGTNVRLRGVSAVDSRVAWASGAAGTYARTTDGGRTWQAGQVPGAAELDFRDVDAFDARTAYLLAIGEGERSRIYKTTDGGRSWTLQFQNRRAGAFYDCMAFWDARRGIAMSDPVGGRFLVVRTEDGGRTWREIDPAGMPPALEGEGGFAASGTCAAVAGQSDAWFGTGGPAGPRVFRSEDGGVTWKVSTAPLAAGKSAGVFSLAFAGAGRGAIVGGDYTMERESDGNVALSFDRGRTWHAVSAARHPAGYRSCVAYVPGTRWLTLVAVGPSGSDFSTDGGRNWRALGGEGFHAVSVAPKGDAAWAVGENGRVARLDAPSGLGQPRDPRPRSRRRTNR